MWSLQDWQSCLTVFPNSGGAHGSLSLCQHGAQHHPPGPGVGGASAVPTRDRRELFTQEGVWRCEKGLSSHCLSPGCAKGLSLGSYQLQTFICLRAASPPSGRLLPTPAPLLPPPQPGPQVSPWLLLLAARPGGTGVTAAAPRRFVTTREQWWDTELCLCSAWALHYPAKGRGGLGCLVFHLAGSLGKA